MKTSNNNNWQDKTWTCIRWRLIDRFSIRSPPKLDLCWIWTHSSAYSHEVDTSYLVHLQPYGSGRWLYGDEFFSRNFFSPFFDWMMMMMMICTFTLSRLSSFDRVGSKDALLFNDSNRKIYILKEKYV